MDYHEGWKICYYSHITQEMSKTNKEKQINKKKKNLV